MKDKEKNQELENLKKDFERVVKENYNLKKENDSAYSRIRQLNREKMMLLHKLKVEIEARIEKECELDILKAEAEELPF